MRTKDDLRKLQALPSDEVLARYEKTSAGSKFNIPKYRLASVYGEVVHEAEPEQMCVDACGTEKSYARPDVTEQDVFSVRSALILKKSHPASRC